MFRLWHSPRHSHPRVTAGSGPLACLRRRTGNGRGASRWRLTAGCTVAATWVALIGAGVSRGEPPIRRLRAVEACDGRAAAAAGEIRTVSAEVPEAEAVAGAPESLEQAWSLAFQAADRLAAARISVSEAESMRSAATAERWPNLDLSASYRLRQDEPSFAFNLSGLGLANQDFPFAQSEAFGFRGAVTLPLYTSGRITSQIEAADAWVQAAQSTVAMECSDLKMRVADEYIGVLRAQSELSVAHSNVRSLEAHANDVEKRFDNGLAARNDFLAAQVSLANARHAAIRAENRLDVAQASYNRRLGRPLSATVQLAELPLPLQSTDLEALTAQALRNRPELSRLAREAAARRREAETLLAQNGLQLGLVGEYGFEENRYQSPQGLASVAVGASWNAFDAGQSRHQAAAAHRCADALLRLRADLESGIRVEVRTAWLNVQETTRHIQVAEEAIGRAEENLRVSRHRYAMGTGTAREVLDAESLRTESERNYSDARYDCVLEMLRLQKAIGEL